MEDLNSEPDGFIFVDGCKQRAKCAVFLRSTEQSGPINWVSRQKPKDWKIA